MDAARFADGAGFASIWLPERHFNKFGGLFPNPAVLGAAIAAVTRQIHIRGGSVVAPLHYPVRIAEEWSVVDNLSKGRIGIAFGSGFHPNDFLLAPDAFQDRKARMFASITSLQELWSGGGFRGMSGTGEEIEVQVFPRPYSRKLPLWLATSRSAETFTEAGEIGAGVLTALLRLSIPELAERIAIYREALRKAGHDYQAGKVTVMLHTFLCSSIGEARTKVAAPLKAYLRSHMEHTRAVSDQKAANARNVPLSAEEEESLLEYALERYLQTSSLIGTEESCLEMVRRLHEVGVDEVACLVDFGVDHASLMSSLQHLERLQARVRQTGHPSEADCRTRLDDRLTVKDSSGANHRATVSTELGLLSGRGSKIDDLQRIDQTQMDRLPLSFAQERLWFFDQFEPANAVYNVPQVMRLHGSLNVSALERSLREIVRRQEVLRTAFTSVNGQPQIVVRDAAAFRLTVTDLQSLRESAKEAEARRLAIEESDRPFDLSHDLMLRAQLWLLGEQGHVLALTMHHIASDGWSLGVFSRELTALYAAYSSDHPSPLAELPIQYVDYAIWQRTWLQGTELERQLAYWKQQLSGAPAALELPTDFPRPAMQSYRGSSQELALSAELTQGLQALSRREGVTLFKTLLAAWQVLLARYSGQEDVVVGSPIAGRNRTDVEGLIGIFVNTLVLRTELSGNPTFRQLLRRVREVTLGAYAHQDLPFEKLVEELQPERNLSHSPFFQVMLVLKNAPFSLLDLSGVSASPLHKDNRTAKFDLTLSLQETADGLRGTLQYNTDLFDAGTITRLIGHFQVLLEGIAADPSQRIGELPLLTAAERQQLLIDWNDTATDYPRDKCVHELFEDQVEQTPDTVAVVFQNQSLTYRDLNARANQLAHHLIGLGVGPEVLVGLCVERSIEMLVGMVGILKAGGAYVPLDPNDPAERRSFFLEDAQASIVLDSDTLRDLGVSDSSRALPRLTHCAGVRVGADKVAKSRGSADQLAYVMYTSGSTGEPKGVCVTHRGVVRLVKGTNYVRLSPSDRFLQYASPSFDASTFEIWGCLLNGGQLVLPPQSGLTLDELGGLIREHQITVLWLTAGLFHLMVEQRIDDLRGVRQMLAGGDVLSPIYVRRALAALPLTTLINGYEPTENTTFSTCHVMTSASDVGEKVSIGRPIANSNVYILDGHLQPVPIGVTGELYIGGDGLAREYLNCPELTAEKFITDPFSDVPGARLYRTGDIVRWRADGNLVFLGRLDHQVKLRGFRIELGEIEAVLARHAQVRQAVVLLREDRPGDKRLVAYLVPQPTQTPPASSDLRRYLQDKLPEYMVPAAFVVLESLPLTPNGKVDRAALPVPEAREMPVDAVAPCGMLEVQLTRIWEDVLNVRPIGVCDNFFELGGHSLLAVKLFDRVAKATRQSLPLATLFECPTIRHLAEALRERNWSPTWKSLVAVQPGGSKPPLFLVPPGSGTVLRFADLARHLGPDQPVYGLEPLGHDDRDQPMNRVEDMVALYLKEIRELQPTGPYLLAGICFGAHVALEMARQLSEQGEHVALVALLDPGPPAHGPTWSPPRRTVKNLIRRVLHHWASGSLSRVVFNSMVVPRLNRIRSCFHATGRRQMRVLDAHRKAQMSHVGRPFAGCVVLIQSEEF